MNTQPTNEQQKNSAYHAARVICCAIIEACDQREGAPLVTVYAALMQYGFSNAEFEEFIVALGIEGMIERRPAFHIRTTDIGRAYAKRLSA